MLVSLDYEIAFARLEDISYLSSIERAAAKLLKGQVPDSILNEAMRPAEFRNALENNRLWVARKNHVPVGFAHAEMLGPTEAHLQELDVRPDHTRRGVGNRLVAAVCTWASQQHLSLSLTTFRDVPFNMPFCIRLGFEVVPVTELGSALHTIIQEETRRGLDPERRVAMRYRVSELL